MLYQLDIHRKYIQFENSFILKHCLYYLNDISIFTIYSRIENALHKSKIEKKEKGKK